MEKIIFWTLKNSVFYSQNRFLFSLQSRLAVFLVFLWPNLNKEEFCFFDQKAGLNPLEKNAILSTLKNSVFYGQKGLFFLRKVT